MNESLLATLADGVWHSGEALAVIAGITRAGLAKRVDKLRELGLDVEARQGLGYRLAQPLERLDAASLQDAAPSGLRVAVVDSTDSTNRQLLDAPAAEDPQALFAEYQTAGRGRRGRVWRSPYGANVYLSLAWSFAAWPPQLTALPLSVGVACARALRDAGLARAQIKWPNDLWVDRRKLGGILIEHRGEAGGACRVVVGIGINVAMSGAQADGIDQAWISLDEALAAKASRNALAAALLQRLHAVLSRFEHEGFAPFAAEWNALDLTRDQPVRISGTAPIDGIARGVDEIGALIIDGADGERRAVHSGDVSLRLA
ncbi:MAG: biotin--[acetyl-CoA-carboxylase] ligase [Hydrocarboniphaga sp.]|uniref:biotin--[acetyl-CoA-carboxylase] ligase n=1 Tax=Hydrocarboniphaga sp. TaxID=2033016 RepID=UPI00262F9240|nr:biotin--[acetyl-CoA-carboxylase] ligase [Hydrocarboniphaga sp.]MDB5972869.1 biotin--[acetyl-CoA-carboxylase] ligase [Hydrocarboniphaga sp.]